MAEIMQNTVKEMKTIQALNLRQKLLNQVSDAYILVTGDITGTGGNANTTILELNLKIVLHLQGVQLKEMINALILLKILIL